MSDNKEDSATSSIPSEFKKVDINAQLQKKVIFGIDLGGTRTRVALIQPKEGGDENDFEVTVVKEIRSVVSFLKDGKCLAGWAADKRTVGSPSNTFYATKRLIGRRYDNPVVQETINHVGYKILEHTDGCACFASSNGNRVLTPVQIEALILLKMKEFCEKVLKDIPLENVVLTVPPYFDDHQVQVTKEAALLAGLNVLGVMKTPIAAVHAYSKVCESLQANKIVVVYDFGGSSFNVTVLKVSEGAANPEVISTAEDLFLGGGDFDKKLVDYLVTELERKTGVNFRLCTTTMQYFKISAENAKIDLSFYTEVDVHFWAIRLYSSSQSAGIERINIKLTRDKLEELVVELINKTVSLCHKALAEAKISVSDIDEVLAIGGTCRIPKVRATIEEIFGKKPIEITSTCIDRVNAVVIGAAFRGDEDSTSEISSDLQQLSPLMSIPKLVKEDEVFNFVISDDDTQYFDAIISNLLASHYLDIYTEEHADSIVRKTCKSTAGNPIDDKAVSYIAVYENLMEAKRNREVALPQTIEDYFNSIKQKRDEFVERKLVQRLPPPDFVEWVFKIIP